MLMYIGLIVIAVISVFFVRENARKERPKIFNVYSQGGKWFYLKYLIFVVVLTVRRWKSMIVKSNGNGLGVATSKNYANLEKPQPFSSHEKAFDAVFFQAINQEGYYICGGVERRHQGKANALLYIVVPEIGLLRSTHLPMTQIDQDPVSLHLGNSYSAGGITFKPVEPMKKWNLAFNGKLNLKSDTSKVFDVKLEADWTNDKFPHFFYDSQLSVHAMARAIAREKWNKTFFDNLKDAHQCHYEQMGKLAATLTVNGTEHKLKMDAFRDHSFGYKRDWSLMYRYAFHMMYLENGFRAILGVICQPCTTSHLEVGFVALPNKKVYPIDSSNLLLYQHGEKGNPGNDIGFTFSANGEQYDVKVSTKYECEHFKGNDKEARLVERFNNYEVNGIKGRGISEWQYRND